MRDEEESPRRDEMSAGEQEAMSCFGWVQVQLTAVEELSR